MKNKNVLFLLSTNIVLFIYVGIFFIVGELNPSPVFTGVLFNKTINLGWVLLIMCILELMSTLTFQIRINLTARYEITQNQKLKMVVPFFAGFSWIIAGLQAIVLIGDSSDLIKTVIKLLPVFIATVNGVYISLMWKDKQLKSK